MNERFVKILRVCAASFLLVAGSNLAVAQMPPLNSPPSNESLPGKFIWFDLASPDLKGQKKFYSNVFGWKFQSVRGMGGYELVMNEGRAIGGLFGYEQPDGAEDGSLWIALMSVANVDQSVNIAKANGGSVEVETENLPGRGRHALIKDPANALFGVLASESGDPVDAEVPVGGFFWVDLLAREPGEIAEFYKKLAPYEIEEREITGELTHTLLNASGMPRAGIVSVDDEANRSAWVPYVRVEDVDATLEKVVDGGGFAVVSPDPVLLGGNLAIFVDPNGAYVGILEWDYEAVAALGGDTP